MAKTKYAVIGGQTRKIKVRYIVDGGITRRIKQSYEVVGGVARQTYSYLTKVFKAALSKLNMSYYVDTSHYETTTQQVTEYDVSYSWSAADKQWSNYSYNEIAKITSTSNPSLYAEGYRAYGYRYRTCSWTREGTCSKCGQTASSSGSYTTKQGYYEKANGSKDYSEEMFDSGSYDTATAATSATHTCKYTIEDQIWVDSGYTQYYDKGNSVEYGSAESIGDYALFVGGQTNSSSVGSATAITNSKSIFHPTGLISSASKMASCALKNCAIFAGGTSKASSHMPSKYINFYDKNLTRTYIPCEYVRESGAAAVAKDIAIIFGGLKYDGTNPTKDISKAGLNTRVIVNAEKTVTLVNDVDFAESPSAAAASADDCAVFNLGNGKACVFNSEGTLVKTVENSEFTSEAYNHGSLSVGGYAVFPTKHGAEAIAVNKYGTIQKIQNGAYSDSNDSVRGVGYGGTGIVVGSKHCYCLNSDLTFENVSSKNVYPAANRSSAMAGSMLVLDGGSYSSYFEAYSVSVNETTNS